MQMTAKKISGGSVHGLGGEKLPAVSYALLPNMKKGLIFAIRDRSILCRLFSTQQRSNVFVSDVWPTPATYHRPFCAYCCPWSRVRRYFDTCRGCVCSLVPVFRLPPGYWLCCPSLLLKPCTPVTLARPRKQRR